MRDGNSFPFVCVCFFLVIFACYVSVQVSILIFILVLK